MKKPRELERITKGVANHRRIEILMLLKDNPGCSLWQIATNVDINFKTASEHVRRLALAELVLKRYQGNTVCNTLTPRGQSILKFLRILE